MDDNNNGNNNPDEPCDDPEDDVSRYLILENPYSLFSVPSPTLTLPPKPSTQNPGPTSTEQADNPISNNCNDADFCFLDDFLKESDFMMNEEINVGRGVGGGDSGAGPSGTKELAFQYIQRSVLNCSECNYVCLVFDSSNGLYDMLFQVHKVADQFAHLIFDVHPSDPEVNTGTDTYYLDLGGYSLEKVNRDLAKYAIYIDQNGWMHVLDSFINVYNKILGGLMNRDQLFADINNTNNNNNNNNNQQNNNQPQNNPPLSPQSDDEEAGGADEDQLLDELDLENLNDVNIVEQVYPWMAERADSNSSSDSEDDPDARPSIAVQRERTAQWTLLDLAPYFHLKAEKASKKLMVCPTTLKIVCRRLHLRRWPYRKISSIDNKISGLKRSIREKVQRGDMHGIISLNEEIEKEKQKRVRLYLFLTRDR